MLSTLEVTFIWLVGVVGGVVGVTIVYTALRNLKDCETSLDLDDIMLLTIAVALGVVVVAITVLIILVVCAGELK